ncbi:MAG TPA: SHOCT domain-containing protein [Solirubrobacteraceae bacterium]|nr:SHOCT domain-containing protein [Solirubrobacteraceae bacterium]
MKAKAAAQAQAALPKPDVADQLTKLADLRDRGVLSDAEFETQKAKILAAS